MNVELPHDGLVFYEVTKYPSALLVVGIRYCNPTMLTAITPWQRRLKDNNTLRLVSALMRDGERFLGGRVGD